MTRKSSYLFSLLVVVGLLAFGDIDSGYTFAISAFATLGVLGFAGDLITTLQRRKDQKRLLQVQPDVRISIEKAGPRWVSGGK